MEVFRTKLACVVLVYRNMEKDRQARLYELLKRGLKNVESGEDLPTEWAREFFPPERREYELVYHGKESE